ncbi:MAG: hypothetical protein E4G99_04435 [Anaerolineales bacterium]|nr:MAG: hypothetical protein E4G99_04435 [Anaerolineales bacterium]
MMKGMLLFLLVLLGGAWLILRPGTFFIPPSAFEPQGVILIYVEKEPGMPVFASPDSLCMAQYGQINSACRKDGENLARSLSERRITRLPYADWAYRFFLPQK